MVRKPKRPWETTPPKTPTKVPEYEEDYEDYTYTISDHEQEDADNEHNFTTGPPNKIEEKKQGENNFNLIYVLYEYFIMRYCY